VALPFVSYGGNALLLYMFLAGLVLNISRYSKEEQGQ
jgi:cell division protein FtsW